MSEKTNILMVEDEKIVLSANKRMLARRGYQVIEASSAKEAFAYLESNTPDLIILDVMLPDGNGFDICKKIRKDSDVPILFLTGKTDINDKVEGLSVGGDYYLTKPFQFEEMLAVVKRLLEKEAKQKNNKPNNIIKKAGLELNLEDMSFTLNGKDIQLTNKEFGLLSLFVQNENYVFSNEELYEKVWKAEAGLDTRTIRKHIMNIRSKICNEGQNKFDIVTVYGKGYVFEMYE